MKTASILLGVTLTLSSLPVAGDDWPQWRGPARDGTSRETGLLGEWPKDGPRLVWKVTDIGSGYSTPAAVGDRLYLQASDSLTNEFVAALSATDGRRLWATRLGDVGNPKQEPNFPTSRSTPTVDGDVLYALGSDGDLACVEVAGGKVRWRKNLRTDFGGKPGLWAYSESPLVDGETVVCSPGGGQATVVALHKRTGEVLWKCATPEGDDAAYASAIVVEVAGVRQYVQSLQKGLVGIDAKSGKLLWRDARAVSRFNANIPTPLAVGDVVFVGSAGTGAGAVRVVARDGGAVAEPLYFEAKLPTAIGGVVKAGDFLYGTTAQVLVCFDVATGEAKWAERAVGAASLCAADGRLYLHGENGEVVLVEPSPDGYREKGRFTPPEPPARKQQMEKAWAYPIVANGRLYLRDQDRLWCYAVR